MQETVITALAVGGGVGGYLGYHVAVWRVATRAARATYRTQRAAADGPDRRDVRLRRILIAECAAAAHHRRVRHSGGSVQASPSAASRSGSSGERPAPGYGVSSPNHSSPSTS
jgi:cobalamin-dependent methionine synthase I